MEQTLTTGRIVISAWILLRQLNVKKVGGNDDIRWASFRDLNLLEFNPLKPSGNCNKTSLQSHSLSTTNTDVKAGVAVIIFGFFFFAYKCINVL